MMLFYCEKCGREFNSKHGRRVHYGYCVGGNRKVRKPHTEKTKLKISQAHIGLKQSVESCRKMSLSRINLKPTNTTREKMGLSKKGSKNPRWNNRSSLRGYPIDWTRELRTMVKRYFNYKCALCFSPRRDKVLFVHHVDYDKENCNLNNLVLLCGSCHSMTNNNRDVWRIYFLGEAIECL